jgi:hypothetical protein
MYMGDEMKTSHTTFVYTFVERHKNYIFVER